MNGTMERTGLGTGIIERDNGHGAMPCELELTLRVCDPEVIAELCRRAEGAPRDEYALSALRLGVLALRQASGSIDSAAVRHEGERLVQSVGSLLCKQSSEMLTRLSESLKRYFDPNEGSLPQRLERLLRKDGELESLLARHVAGEGSTIAQTLVRHVGEQSPLLRTLSPNQKGGVLAELGIVVEKAMKEQRELILRQFSLDDKASALSRLVGDITGANGRLKNELAGDLDKVRREFSMDNEEGALARLVRRVEDAQRTISSEFSQDNEASALNKLSRLLETTHETVESKLTLDDEKSPLSRLRRELLELVGKLDRSNTDFHAEVRAILAALSARKQEALRGTQHGRTFEDAVGEVLQAEVQRLGDLFESVGARAGQRAYCKKGDHMIELGAESAAPGARIVCEAKEDKSYTVRDALVELREARENRAAQAGIFVFSKLIAPAGQEPITRQGEDVLVVWDQDDPSSDLFLKAGFWIARALVVRQCAESQQSAVDLAGIGAAIGRVAEAAAGLGEITTWATTIKNNGERISDKADKLRRVLESQVESLREQVEALRPARIAAA